MADEDGSNSKQEEITLISLSQNGLRKTQKALQTEERFCCGYLLGKILENELKVYDLIELDLTLFKNVDATNSVLSGDIQAEFASIRASFPVGIDFVGVFITQPENGNLEVAEHLLHILKLLEDIAYASMFAVCLIKPSSSVWFMSYDDENMICIDNIAECDDDLSKQPLFHLHQEVLINWLTSSGEDGLQHEIDRIDSEFIGHKPAFLIEPIRTMLFEDDYGATKPDVTCKELIADLKATLGVRTWPEVKHAGNVLDVNILVRITSEGNNLYELTTDSSLDIDFDNEKSYCNVPVLWSQTVAGESCVIKLCIDALVTASIDTPTSRLIYMFRDAVFRQRNALSLLTKIGKNKFLYKPYHFQPAGTSIPITAFLPTVDFCAVEASEDAYIDYRRLLHHRFLLPNDRPLLRKNLSYFVNRGSDGYHLVNPHRGLNPPDMEDGKLAFVYGNYSYHHYMQDNFDDNIWGCAYRSLQTVSSWFWHQGYTERTYPSHREIQEALVAIGDKEKSFVGSKEWIGSVEVSYCLDYFYGVTSKTLHVSNGGEMAYKGRDIYRHFVEEGTPIMIGGGVLAHTIVGIMFNEHTSAVKFLIVDPHFTGSDQLKTVQSKGWVSWKGPDFWNQTAHYNLCMPQRPKML